MKISGSNVIPLPLDAVWDAVLDPAVLVQSIPGCSRLEATGEHAYAMTVTAGVAAIKGTYDGSCALSELAEHESLTMRLQGAGAPGTVDATVAVRFEEVPEGTQVTWDADAVVGGMVGGVGQRMLGSVSKRMAGEFFSNVGDTLTRQKVSDGSAVPGEVFSAPRAGAAASQEDFLRGVAVGAGLVLLGVVAQGLVGGLFGRRRS
ncbi:carbon monoxide dehydrogenase subunit G [Nocardioides sp. cx-173]|uniref:SRPBCC family protein n=1 Tax=Nocardioides sp. cx-173 TaxID=2898796 RepID=UPI001E5C8C3E|nr:carbon monoxide dehydrogenase subunit G [Nocardioides sp. cx-173]MCD4525413.1 carbon monoxide dehydrogenase subunit G [Nocardioides sp. cx-173]UGB40792.1 carbon monoxide dehydrogenase subunit G [Nocardioides sp. cx-173]